MPNLQFDQNEYDNSIFTGTAGETPWMEQKLLSWHIAKSTKQADVILMGVSMVTMCLSLYVWSALRPHSVSIKVIPDQTQYEHRR